MNPVRVLGLIFLSLAATPDTEPVLEPIKVRLRTLQQSPLQLEFEIPQGDRGRWVRLLGHIGPVRVNGLAIASTNGDKVTSTTALSPYLEMTGSNVIELAAVQTGTPFVELLPRVFVAAAAQESGRIRILVENTLDNASNVQVEIAGLGSRDAYVPPSSQVEVTFPGPVPADARVVLTKFAEALEEGYTAAFDYAQLPALGGSRPPL